MSTTTADPGPVFLSHSSSDEAAAWAICRALENTGTTCWLAPRDMPEGPPYPGSLTEAVRACGALLLVLSPEALASPDVYSEVAEAFRSRRPRVVVEIKPTTIPTEWEHFLITPQRVAVTDLDLEEADALNRIITATSNVLGKPPVLLEQATDETVDVPDDNGLDSLGEFRNVPTEGVVTLIATASTVVPGRPLWDQAAGSLLLKLPDLKRLVLVVGRSDSAAQARLCDALQEHATSNGREVTISRQPFTLSPFDVLFAEQRPLRQFLRRYQPSPSVRVDVTGGTIPMTLAVKRAAQLERHHVTYCARDLSRGARWLGWVDVTEATPWRTPTDA